LQQLSEGLRYTQSHPRILPALLLAANAGLLGVSLLNLFPAYAALVLHSPTDAYTLISVANGLGGIIAGLLLGQMARRLGVARLVATSTLLTALSMGLLAIAANTLTATLVAFAFGLVIVTLFVAASTLIQTEVPDTFRGRVLALYNLAFSGLTPFGALALGFISANLGVLNTFALSAALSGLISLIVLVRWPGLWQSQLVLATKVG
jgi:MFS family permease